MLQKKTTHTFQWLTSKRSYFQFIIPFHCIIFHYTGQLWLCFTQSFLKASGHGAAPTYLGHCQCCGSREKRIQWEHMRVPKAPTQKGPHNTSSYMSLVTVSHMAYSEVNGTGKYKCTLCKWTEASLPQHPKISIEIILIRGAKFPCSIVELIIGARGTGSSDWFRLGHMIQPWHWGYS